MKFRAATGAVEFHIAFMFGVLQQLIVFIDSMYSRLKNYPNTLWNSRDLGYRALHILNVDQ